ncbi:hypothetical protein BBP40_005767 [Aspergillus hancockii]|nr:hypothetical protein BBP40_005767 [Aspergillus hancockii]
MDPDASITPEQPPVFNYILSFLLVGVAWGFTTPFIRRAATDFNARQEQHSQPSSEQQPPAQQGTAPAAEEQELQQTSTPEQHRSGAETEDSETDEEDRPPPSTTRPVWMRQPGSNPGWLRTKITKLSLTVPLANSSAFLFTVLGECKKKLLCIIRESNTGLIDGNDEFYH